MSKQLTYGYDVLGYTKHYYLGSERIATTLGEGGWGEDCCEEKSPAEQVMSRSFTDYYANLVLLNKHLDLPKNVDIEGNDVGELQYDCAPSSVEQFSVLTTPVFNHAICDSEKPSGSVEMIFFTHSNHLGSASWITDKTATPVQYLHYAPYGELLANQMPYSYDERYKFTGKERDTESGYDNFGARYLAGQLGIWTRPDPLLNDYLYVTPYMYCEGNPIKYVDPDGREKNIFYRNERICQTFRGGGS